MVGTYHAALVDLARQGLPLNGRQRLKRHTWRETTLLGFDLWPLLEPRFKEKRFEFYIVPVKQAVSVVFLAVVLEPFLLLFGGPVVSPHLWTSEC